MSGDTAEDDTMSIETYLERGGVLTSPLNTQPRYRGELMRLMASFVDSELAGAAGFADIINAGPGIKERIAASRIVLEKTDHAERVLEVMASFGADITRYANQHPWTARVERDADIGITRHGQDMRLNVFHYPLQGWTDAVTMNVLMGSAVVVQLDELTRVSYQPLAEVFRFILPRERRHAELGVEGFGRIVRDHDQRPAVEASLAYWYPRVTTCFGAMGSARFDTLKRFGLRHIPNETLVENWQSSLADLLASLSLTCPDLKERTP